MLNIVVLISGHGSNLQAIINAIDSGQLNAHISAIICNKANAAGLERARTHNIPAYLLQKHKSQTSEEYDLRLQEVLNNLKPDLVVLAGFMRILSKNLVNQFKGKIINIHPSLLPKYRGLSTHERVLNAGDDTHGCSVHFVTPDLDGGPVIAQASFEIASKDNINSLSAKVQLLEHKLYPMIVAWFALERLELNDEQVFLDGTLMQQPYLME